jgi:beta-lactamase class A
MERRDVVGGSGVLKDLTAGRVRLTLRDAAMLMITVSDNTATNLLIDRLGAAAINQTSWNAGFGSTWLQGRLRRSRTRRSRTTPRDLGTLLTRLARRQVVSRAPSNAMLDILRREQSDNIVGLQLPDDTYGRTGRRRTWKIASKAGWNQGEWHDAALVEGRGVRYVIVLMSRGSEDLRFSVDNEASVCLAHLARAVHDHLAGRT